MADVETTVLDIIAKKAKVEGSALSRATELSSLTLDSLDFVEIVFELEEALDIALPYNANEAASGAGFKTVGDVVDLVVKHAGQQDERRTV